MNVHLPAALLLSSRTPTIQPRAGARSPAAAVKDEGIFLHGVLEPAGGTAGDALRGNAPAAPPDRRSSAWPPGGIFAGRTPPLSLSGA
jgi:hypothetical protein